MIRAVLFDLDGTLADTAQDLASALNRLRAEHRMAPLAPELTRALASSGARGLLKVGFDLDPNDERYPPMRDRFLDLYEQALCVHTQLYEGMAELLGELERRALAWGIVTNKPRRFTDPLVRELRLHARAACVVSGDTTSKPKPAPDPLLHAAGVMRIAPQACLSSPTYRHAGDCGRLGLSRRGGGPGELGRRCGARAPGRSARFPRLSAWIRPRDPHMG